MAEIIANKPYSFYAWDCLCFLAGGQPYEGEAAFLENFHRNSGPYHRFFVFISTLISDNLNERALGYAFHFLSKFLFNNCYRQLKVGENSQMLTALFNFMIGPINNVREDVQHFAMRALELLVTYNGDTNGHGYVWSWLKHGGLPVVTTAALNMLSRPARLDVQVKSSMCTLLEALKTILLVRPIDKTLDFEPTKYMYGRNDIFRLNTVFYKLLADPNNPHLSDTTYCVLAFAKYLESYAEKSALPALLLHKPPRNAFAEPVVILLMRAARKEGQVRLESDVNNDVSVYAGVFPEVGAVVSTLRLPVPRQRARKDRRCAFEHCDVTGEGLFYNLQKCKRCRAVYYCCKEHQEEHWRSGHKENCVKKKLLNL